MYLPNHSRVGNECIQERFNKTSGSDRRKRHLENLPSKVADMHKGLQEANEEEVKNGLRTALIATRTIRFTPPLIQKFSIESRRISGLASFISYRK